MVSGHPTPLSAARGPCHSPPLRAQTQLTTRRRTTGNFPPLGWSRRGKSSEDLPMSPLSAPHLKTATTVNQSAERELRMEMAVGQGRQSDGRYNTNRRGWFSRMVRPRFTEDNLPCS